MTRRPLFGLMRQSGFWGLRVAAGGEYLLDGSALGDSLRI